MKAAFDLGGGNGDGREDKLGDRRHFLDQVEHVVVGLELGLGFAALRRYVDRGTKVEGLFAALELDPELGLGRVRPHPHRTHRSH